MVNNPVNMSDVIKELENTYNIPQTKISDKEKIQYSGASLFTYLFYISKDSLGDRTRVTQKLLSDILAICGKRQKMPIELASNDMRQGLSSRSDSSSRSSTPCNPLNHVSLDVPSESNDRVTRYSTPTSEYQPLTPSTEISQISEVHVTQTQQRSSEQIQPTNTIPIDGPNCILCQRPTTREVTKIWNRNGHGGRPYFRCGHCDKFHSFADNQGISKQNPLCQCDQHSRLELAGRWKGRSPYFTCATGACNFYSKPNNSQSKALTSIIAEMQGTSLRSEQRV
ncbi:hypothetical protein F5884DRAFT_746377 [Xylogone sp. PMI_703]|nr:hypothetical protein F5884DRAFT_746377 [Xylogone sp. PMI_703]